MFNKQLLEILACPLCKGDLHYDHDNNCLICKQDKLSYPIRDDIPIMLLDEAKPWTDKKTS